MSQENLQTMIMQNFWGVKEVYYGIVQVVNTRLHSRERSKDSERAENEPVVPVPGAKTIPLDHP